MKRSIVKGTHFLYSIFISMSLIKTYIRKSSEFINVRRRGQHCNDNMTMENITLLSGQGTSWCRGKYIEPDQNLRLALLFILRLFLLSWKDMRGKCRNVRVKYMGDSKVSGFYGARSTFGR